MTTQYIDNTGQQISLGKLIGKGGEGSVYEIAGDKHFVAKIYHQSVTTEKATKLAAMTAIGKPEIMAFAAWPRATLHQSDRRSTWGIVLPRVTDSREIHELYGPQHRKQYFPTADWRFLIRVARNCAAAFASLHEQGIVIGDVNQGNVFVSRKATVNLIDCDSFQLAANGRVFRCGVGVAHFVPPELQTVRLSEVTRSPNHDNFGLAILIFQLLLMGKHPFQGRYSGPDDMPIERAIREYRFPYSPSAARFLMAPPPNALTLAHLPQEVGTLFERAFSKGAEAPNGRPTAAQWATVLNQLETGLRKCDDDQGHFYPNQLRSCPWCEIVSKGGPNFFISVTIQTVLGKSTHFDIAAIWAQIEAVPQPGSSSQSLFLVDSKRFTPRPLPDEQDHNRVLRHLVGIIFVICCALTLLIFAFANVALFSIPLGTTFGVWWLGLKLLSPMQQFKRERTAKYKNARKELDATLSKKDNVAGGCQRQFQEKYTQLRSAKKRHGELIAQRNTELQMLQQQVRQYQLDAYLRGQFISDAKIPKIGPTRVATLESYGIETAYDIELSAILAIHGFGSATAENLIVWRRQIEAGFRFDPARGVPQDAIQAVEIKFAQARIQCESILQRGPKELRQVTDAANVELSKFNSWLPKKCDEVAQLRADLRVFDRIPWWY